MMFLKKALSLACAFVISGNIAFAQHEQKSLVSAKIRAVVDSLNQVILKNYIYPDTAANMVDYIKKELAAGKYDGIEAAALARRLNTDLHFVYNDKHMKVEYSASLSGEAANSLYILQAARQMQIAETAKLQNYGVSSAAILNGNIGYIKLNGFFDLNDKSIQTVNSAFDLLKNVNALIIDLRLNGGGQADMAHYISSLFFKKSVHLNDFYVRNVKVLQQNWSTPRAESNIWDAVPLYILVSSYTCSAAEEFAYDMQSLHRAIIVGEVTQGAAHPMERVDIGSGFLANIPFARPINPITKTDWEPHGIRPDRLLRADKALAASIQMIFKYQINSTDSVTSKNARWLYSIYKAKHLHSYELNLLSLKRFAGNYEGNKISVEKGNLLFFTSSTGYRVKLIPIAKNTFLLSADFDNRKLIFQRNKRGTPDKMYFNLDGNLSAVFKKY